MAEINVNSSISELIDSINNSMEDMRNHPIETKKLPSNFEILIKGISNSNALETLFSPKVDALITSMFANIAEGDFTKILENKDVIENLMTSIFGEGSFQGPVSQTVLGSIQSTMTSYKYNTMRSYLGKTMTQIKKTKLVLKNLDKASSTFEKGSDEYKKYKDAVYAIKKVLRFAAKVYRNRKIVNKKVFEGLNNIVHEDIEFCYEDDTLRW